MRLTIYKDKGAALFQNSVHGGKSEARALGAFRGKEWLEDACLGLAIHAHAGVADREHDVVARSNRTMGTREIFVEGHIGGLNGQLPALRHCIARIYGKIHNDL